MADLKIKRLNILPMVPDERDYVYKLKKNKVADEVDLRQYDSPVEDQGALGSCVGNAICNAFELLAKQLFPDKFQELSKLYVYYHSRFFDESIDSDTGSYLRDGLKAAKNYGICTEALWPYDTTKFDSQPSPKCYLDGFKRYITQYEILYTTEEMVEALNAKKPVVVAMEVFDSFNQVTKDNPMVPIPNGYGYSIGLHAVAIVGYSIPKKQFLLKNSWGTNWGDKGYAWIPFTYIDNFASERWTFDINNQNTTS